jgi:hypothetical protein
MTESRPISRTALLERVKAFDVDGVRRGVAASPGLLAWRDERGRSFLHIVCATPPKTPAQTAASIAIADVLIAAGLDISEAAFTEDEWRATPLWCAIGRGRNHALATHLLELGCDREHCLWAAQFARDPAAIRLLVAHGAKIDPVHEEGTPFMAAIKWSHFAEAEVFLDLGADVDVKDAEGLTALHLLLKKGSDVEHVRMLIRHGANMDIADAEGRTAREIMGRKKDAAFRALAEEPG